MSISADVRARGAAAIDLIGRDFVRNAAATLGSRAALLLIGLVSSIVVIRTLGPSGRGVYATAATLSVIGIQLANLGLHASNTWAVSREPGLRSALIGNSLVLSVVLGGIVAVLVGGVLLVDPAVLELPLALLLVALVTIPLGLGYLFLQSIALGVGSIRAYNLIELAIRGLGMIALVGLASTAALDPLAALVVNLVMVAAGLGMMLGVLASQQGLAIAPRLDLFREHLSYGLRGYLAALFSFLVLRSDILIIQALRGSDSAGQYSAAVTLAEIIYLGPVVVGSLLFPRLAAMEDATRQRRTTRALIIGAITTVGTIAMVVGVLSDPIVVTLFGEAFEPAAPALVWLLPGLAMLSGYTIAANYFAARGMPAIAVIAPAVGFGANLVLNMALIPTLGIVGASMASTSAYGLMLGVILVAFAREGSTPRA
jgi:O-antigen/teichoic acid export membrane protein